MTLLLFFVKFTSDNWAESVPILDSLLPVANPLFKRPDKTRFKVTPYQMSLPQVTLNLQPRSVGLRNLPLLYRYIFLLYIYLVYFDTLSRLKGVLFLVEKLSKQVCFQLFPE